MTDLVQMPAYVLALSFVVGIVVSALKGGIEALLPPANRWHDLLFTLLPLALSVGTMLGYVLTHGGDVFMAVVWGALSGSGAVGAYTVHTRTRNTDGDGAVPAAAPQLAPDAHPATTGMVGPSVAITASTPIQRPPEQTP